MKRNVQMMNAIHKVTAVAAISCFKVHMAV